MKHMIMLYKNNFLNIDQNEQFDWGEVMIRSIEVSSNDMNEMKDFSEGNDTSKRDENLTRFGISKHLLSNLKLIYTECINDLPTDMITLLLNECSDFPTIEVSEWLFSIDNKIDLGKCDDEYFFSSMNVLKLYQKHGLTDNKIIHYLDLPILNKDYELIKYLIKIKDFNIITNVYELRRYLYHSIRIKTFERLSEIILNNFPDNTDIKNTIFNSAIKNNNIEYMEWCQSHDLKPKNITKLMKPVSINSKGLTKETLELLSDWGYYKFST